MHQLQQHGYERLGIWSRGVDVSLFTPHRKNAEMRSRLSDGNSDRPLLMYVGRLAMEKRVDWLLPVLYANPGARLAIVGDGPARAKLQELFTNEPVFFTGYLRGIDLAAAYASADWFVFPSANETFGNVVLEAMASGLPVIAADTGGQVDQIYHGRNGLLFKADQLDSMVNTTTRALHSSDLRELLAHNAWIDSSDMSWERVFEDLLGQYEETVRIHQKGKAKISHPGLFNVFPAPEESF
jgi:glycosyltransferase involved in cell wall biosynthesis